VVKILNTVISFTFGQLVAGVLAICAGISCIAAAIGWVIKGIQAAKAPAKKVDERLKAIEDTLENHKGYFTSDKKRLDAIEGGSRVTQKAILALLSHGIDGNDVDAMRAAKAELQEYLIERT
jgi:hypothetical protein